MIATTALRANTCNYVDATAIVQAPECTGRVVVVHRLAGKRPNHGLHRSRGWLACCEFWRLTPSQFDENDFESQQPQSTNISIIRTRRIRCSLN